MQIAIPADRYQAIEARSRVLRPGVRRRSRSCPGWGGRRGGGDAAHGEQLDRAVRAADQPVPAGRASARCRVASRVRRVLPGDADPADRGPAVRRARPSGQSPTVVIISEAVARRFFADDSAVGRMIRLGPNTVGDRRCRGRHPPSGSHRRAAGRHVLPRQQGPGTGHDPLHPDPRRSGAAVGPAARGAARDRVRRRGVRFTPTMSQVASDSVRVTQLVLWLLGDFRGDRRSVSPRWGSTV